MAMVSAGHRSWTRRRVVGTAPLALGAVSSPLAALAQGLVGAELMTDKDLETARLAARERILAAMAATGVGGVAVAMVYRDEPLWVEGFGVTNTPGRPVDDRTIFSLESISKNFTATAIMIAAQDGLLDLDKPISHYLPRFKVHSRFDGAPERTITLRLLLSHRAGFAHEAPAGNNYDLDAPSFGEHIRSISDTWLRYPVGERYCYSNLGVDLAGYVLQRASGVGFAEYLRMKLFEPLGMTDSTADPKVYAARENRAIGHSVGHALVPLLVPMIPSGGVYTSARDMSRYAAFHLGKGRFHGKQVLRLGLWEEMHAFPYGGAYSLGIGKIDATYERGVAHIFDHDGGGFGFEATFIYCPQTQFSWTAMINGAMHGDTPNPHAFPYPPEVARKAFGNVMGRPVPPTPPAAITPVAMTPTQAQGYAGTYIGRDVAFTLTAEDATLRFKWNGADSKLAFTSPTKARVADGPLAQQEWIYHPARGDQAAYFEWADGSCYDYNDGPNDPPGPADRASDRIVGKYTLNVWGKPSAITLHTQNGYLYLDQFRLFEFRPGLYFTADGEAADFRTGMPTWRNIRLNRSARPAS
jgi:CubicO group peptidase (beta-lactamase class C family)